MAGKDFHSQNKKHRSARGRAEPERFFDSPAPSDGGMCDELSSNKFHLSVDRALQECASPTAQCPLAGRIAAAEDVASYLGISVRTLRRWCRAGTFPQPVKMGRVLRFIGSEIAAWIETRMRHRTSTENSHGNA